MKFYQPFLPYLVAITSTAIALLLTLCLEPFLLHTIGAFFYLAIILTAWYGGWRSGLVAVVFAALEINYFFIPARYQFTFEQPKDIFEFAIFLLVSLTINLVTSNFRGSKQLAQENAELLRLAPSAVQMGMWNWDIATGKVQWSEDHELLFGLAPGTFDGKYETFLACLHPDDRQPVNQALQQAIQDNSLYQQEFRVVWSDGSIHWIEGRGHAFYNEAGQPMQMTGTGTAIDERKQAQGLLQHKFEQQRLVMEVTQRIRTSLNLQDILQTTVDEIRQLLQCDRAIVFQFDPQWRGTVLVESVGADWTAILSTEIYDPCFGENYVEPYKQGLVTVKSDIYKAGIDPCHLQLLANFQVRANLVVPIVKGNQLWGLLIAHHCAAPHQWQDAEIDLMRQLAAQVSIALQQSELFEQVQTELAERKQADIALQQLNAELEQRVRERTAELSEVNQRLQEAFITLQESEERRRLALDLTHIGFWDLHLPSGKLIWNDNLFTLQGLTPHSIEPSYELCRSVVHPDDRGWVEQQFLESMENYTDYVVEYRVVHPDNSVHWVMARGKAIYDELGQPARSLGVVFDITDRKRAEETLQQYERIISHTKDGIAMMNRHYIYQIANQGYLSWCNKSAHEVIGNSVRNILGQELFDNFIQPRLEQCFAGETIQYEKWFDYPNLVPQFLSVTYAPYRDASENISGVIVSLRDLTQLKQAEQMLELQAVITRNMAEGICLIRADNAVIVYANPKFEQMFGYDSGELNGQHVSIVNYTREGVTAEDVNQAIRSAVFQSGEASYEVHNVKKDGTSFWCRATTSVFRHPDYGDVLVAVHQDITEMKHLEEVRKQAEEALTQSEAKFRSLSESSPIGIFMTDIYGQCNYTNPRYQAICDCTFDEALGEGWAQFIHPEDREEVTAKWLEAVSQKQVFSAEVRCIHKDATIRFCQVRSASILSVSGELIGYVGTVEDVTESRAIEKMKSEFISIVSHELRTPLASIRGSLGLLASSALKNKPETSQQMLNIAIHDTERLVRLVNDILDLERLESQKVNLNKQWCDAATLIYQSVKTVQSLAVENNINLSVEPTSVRVWVDSDRIIQTLVNLIGNAIKFSPSGTTVTLSVQEQAERVLFQVKDQGRGIPADKLETIFGRFQQVDASDSRQKGGTGLGLAICKSIVQQHGGRIWVESVPGQGSNFYFTLPKLLD
ncbi:PAS domain-containing protein [Aerosakkonema sp. BLCC-F183]|uniref:PAS domain-containing protein n=1 Tax=Aerosakkonema sp. BLCC-F183 TaxID=3342834 RepID=UPI0035B8A86C